MEFHYAEPQTEMEHVFGGHFHINAVGKILSGDDEKFKKFLELVTPPPRTIVYINSIGGDVDAAMGIGRLLRAGWFSTSIGSVTFDYEKPVSWIAHRNYSVGVCHSAATLAYLGGRLRYLPSQFEFGVHQFSFKDPTPDPLGYSQIISARIAKYLHDMGVSPEFGEVSSAIPGSEIVLLDQNQLKKLGVVTGGETGVTWSVEARNKILYVKGERDSLYGHHKVMLCFAKGVGFQFWSVIEAQGRETELTGYNVVEIILNGERDRIDISDRCFRGVFGRYVNIFSKITEEEARRIAYSESFGVQVRFSLEASVFFGVSAMDASAGSDTLTTFYENLSL